MRAAIRIFLKTLTALVLSTACLHAQAERSYTLDNGIDVIFIDDPGAAFCSAVLVCHLPQDYGAEFRANLSLLNHLVWSGGTSRGLSVKEHEFPLIALRFNGSISSQVTADALLIHYTLPREYLDEIFSYIALQLTGTELIPESLREAKEKVAASEQAARSSSVMNQLLRELQSRLWEDLPYRFRGTGSDGALDAATIDSVKETIGAVKNPSYWTLVVAGDFDTEKALADLRSTLGLIGADSGAQSEEEAVRRAVRLGVRLQLPASLSGRHALLAYRLPPAAQTKAEGMQLLAEYLRRSPGTKQLAIDLSGEGRFTEVRIGLDMRNHAGMLYLYASWESEISNDEVLERLSELAKLSAEDVLDSDALESARKALLISYWTRRESTQAYALWRAQRLAVGISRDEFPDRIGELDEEALRELAGELLTKDNRLTLVTIGR